MNPSAHTFFDASDSDDDLADNINVNDNMPQQMNVQQEIPDELTQLEADTDQQPQDGILPAHLDPTKWQRYIVIKGEARTDKTHAIHRCIDKCISQGLSVLVATLDEYHSKFGHEIAAETIHSAFHFPVSRTERPTHQLGSICISHCHH